MNGKWLGRRFLKTKVHPMMHSQAGDNVFISALVATDYSIWRYFQVASINSYFFSCAVLGLRAIRTINH